MVRRDYSQTESDANPEKELLMRPRLHALVVIAACASFLLALGHAFVISITAGALAPQSKPLYDIALVDSFSGAQRQTSRNIEFGAKLAINQANSSGRLPFRLALVVYNTTGDSTRAASIARQVVANQRVIAIVGPTITTDVESVAPLTSLARLALVTPSATYPPLATSGWTDFFRVPPDDGVQGVADANFLVSSKGASRLFIVSDGTPYGSLIAASVIKQANALGATTMAHLAPATTQCQAGSGDASQYHNVALSALASQATALFYGGYYCDFGLLLNSLKNVGFHGVVMSGNGSDSPALLNAVSSPSSVDGVYLSSSSVTSSNASFNKSFASLAHYSAQGATFAPESFDATNAIINALKSLKNVSRPAVVSALRRVSFTGVSGKIRFQANGNLQYSRAFLNQVQGPAISPVGAI